jgi:hypothetical protein
MGGELGLSVNRGGRRMTLSHARPLEEIDGVLSLRQEQAVGGDGDAEEVVKSAQVGHGELRLEASHESLQKSGSRGGEDDVVDVE